jgi:hypothetical protein
MTINEMLKKVDTFNEMSEMLGVRFNTKACLVMIDNSTVVSECHTVNDMKSFRKTVKEIYVDEFAKAILTYKDYEFNSPVTFERVDVFGYKQTMRIEFTV